MNRMKRSVNKGPNYGEGVGTSTTSIASGGDHRGIAVADGIMLRR